MELLIAVAILGILAAVAVPGYQGYMEKSRRTDAKATLLALQNAMEKFRGNCTQYPANLGNADVCGANSANSTIAFSATSDEGYYNLSISNASANTYTLTADPTGTQAGDSDCDPMTITVNTSNPKGLKGDASCW